MRLSSSSSFFIATLASSASLSALAAPADTNDLVNSLANPQVPGVPGLPSADGASHLDNLQRRDNAVSLASLAPILGPICNALEPIIKADLCKVLGVPRASAAEAAAVPEDQEFSRALFAAVQRHQPSNQAFMLDATEPFSSAPNATTSSYPSSSATPSSVSAQAVPAPPAGAPAPPSGAPAPPAGGPPSPPTNNLPLPLPAPPLPALPLPAPPPPALPLPALPLPIPNPLSPPLPFAPPNSPSGHGTAKVQDAATSNTTESATPPGATSTGPSPSDQPPLLPNASAQDYASFSSTWGPDATPSADASSSSAYPSYPTSA